MLIKYILTIIKNGLDQSKNSKNELFLNIPERVHTLNQNPKIFFTGKERFNLPMTLPDNISIQPDTIMVPFTLNWENSIDSQQLLTHVNPYTGNAYINEPAVIMVEIVNENSLVEAWFDNRLLGLKTTNESTGKCYSMIENTPIVIKPGAKPTTIELISGEITINGLKGAKSITIQHLDGSGNPIRNFSKKVKRKTVTFSIGDDVTVWYYLTVQR